MAVITLESVVLHGVCVATDVATGLKRIGSNPAMARTSAVLSQLRHPSPTCPQAGYQPGARQCHADLERMDTADTRAGRPEGGVGVVPSRSLATLARLWPLAAREPASEAGRFGSTRTKRRPFRSVAPRGMRAASTRGSEFGF